MSTNQDEVAVNRNDDFLIASDSEDIVFTTCDNFNAATNNDRCGVSTTTFRKSCNSCSRSKKKCLLSPNSSICTGCKRLNISCIFAYKRKSGPQPNKKKILSEPNTYNISGTSTDGEDSLSTSEHSDSNEQQLYGQESKKPPKKRGKKAPPIQHYHTMQDALQYAMSHSNVKITIPSYQYVNDDKTNQQFPITMVTFPMVLPYNFLTLPDSILKAPIIPAHDSLQAAAALCGLQYQN